MNAHHKSLLNGLASLPTRGESKQFSAGYTGSHRKAYSVSSPDMRGLVKAWLNENKKIPAADVFDTVQSLMSGESHEEKKMAAYVLGYRRDARALVEVQHLDHWLDDLTGWAEVDCLCQNVFTAREVLDNWEAWEGFLNKMVLSDRTEKRRSSLVFLVGPVRKSDDPRLHGMAFGNMENLMHETDILITKAISWLLRSMVGSDRQAVIEFVNRHEDQLPKIALRETRKLLETGKKTS